MAEELTVEIRENTGKHKNRRLRKAGSIPAVLYGHGAESVCLAVSAEQLDAAIRHGSRLVSLIGDVRESAFIREVQWDTWALHILHVDFTRVSADEKVEVHVPVELRGEAPGVRAGGVVIHLIHEVDLECPAAAVPDKLEVNINSLKLEDSVTVADLELPAGATVKGSPEAVVVHCVVPAEEPEEVMAEAAPGEPEVIGAKEEEGETEEKGR